MVIHSVSVYWCIGVLKYFVCYPEGVCGFVHSGRLFSLYEHIAHFYILVQSVDIVFVRIALPYSWCLWFHPERMSSYVCITHLCVFNELIDIVVYRILIVKYQCTSELYSLINLITLI